MNELSDAKRFVDLVRTKAPVVNGESVAIVPGEHLTEQSLKDPPKNVERMVYDNLKDVPPRIACRASFWAEVTLRHIEEGAIEDPRWLVANGGQTETGAARIDKARDEKDPERRNRRIDACVRTALRRMGGLTVARGNRSVFVDAPFARAWWRERMVSRILERGPAAEDQSALVESGQKTNPGLLGTTDHDDSFQRFRAWLGGRSGRLYQQPSQTIQGRFQDEVAGRRYADKRLAPFQRHLRRARAWGAGIQRNRRDCGRASGAVLKLGRFGADSPFYPPPPSPSSSADSSRAFWAKRRARRALALARDLPNRRAALDDVRRKLDVFEQGGHSRILGVYRFRRQLNDAWDAVLESAEKSLDSAREAVNDIAPADLDFGANDQDDAPNDALAQAHQSLVSVMDNLRRNLIESVSIAARQIEGIRAGVDAAEWRAAVEASQTEYEAAVNQLRDVGISDPAEYDALLDSAAILNAEIQRLTGQRETAEDLERQAADTLAEYRRELRELSRKRKQFASEVSSGSDTLRLQVRELSDHGDQDELPERIGEIIGTSAFQSDREAIADMIRPPNGGEWTWSRLDDVAAKIRLLQSGEIESWGGRDRRFESALKRVAPEMIDRLTLYAPKDGVQVEFRDNKRSGWSSLSQGSPGQQTAALLAFVLSFGNEPIILDQPEDDLDNTVIYELLVNRLKEKKRERQVIVVTHNPNIVVHGDAEFVVSLDFRNGADNRQPAGRTARASRSG